MKYTTHKIFLSDNMTSLDKVINDLVSDTVKLHSVIPVSNYLILILEDISKEVKNGKRSTKI
jgi:hypothetical protein